jgi:hypothetical protein
MESTQFITVRSQKVTELFSDRSQHKRFLKLFGNNHVNKTSLGCASVIAAVRQNPMTMSELLSFLKRLARR